MILLFQWLLWVYYHYHYCWYGTTVTIMNMLFSTIKVCDILWPWARFGGGPLSFILFWTLSFATWPWSICMHPQIHLNKSFYKPNSKYFRSGIGLGGWMSSQTSSWPMPRTWSISSESDAAMRDRKAPGGKRGKNEKTTSLVDGYKVVPPRYKLVYKP